MRTTDGGATWIGLYTGFPTSNGITPQLYSINTIAVDAAQVLSGAQGAGLYQLAGASWSVVSAAGLPAQNAASQPQALQFDASGNLYYTLFDYGQGIYRTSGAAWSLIEPGAWSGAGAAKLVPVSTGTLLAVMYDQLPQRSANAGASWTNVTAADTGFTRLAFIDVTENPNAPGQLLAASNKGVFRSTDDGVSWSRLTLSGALVQTALSAILYSPAVNALVFAADRGGNVYCSQDNGQMWSAMAALSAPVIALRSQSNEIWALTDGAGVVRLTPTCP